jgi:hypothetical protein
VIISAGAQAGVCERDFDDAVACDDDEAIGFRAADFDFFCILRQ